MAANPHRGQTLLAYESHLFFERGQGEQLRRLLGRYEELARVAGSRSGGDLIIALKNHAQELSNTSIMDRIQELKIARDTLPEYEYHCRKEHFLRALQITLPGNRSTQLVIKHKDQITADPASMADALRAHWARVFESKPTHGQKVLVEWYSKHPYGFSRLEALDKDEWKVRMHHVELAI